MIKFIEKLNKKQVGFYSIQEEITTINGVYESFLEHDNVDINTIKIWTGSGSTGIQVKSYVLNTPEETPWKYRIKIFSDIKTLYINYETIGDTLEAGDINDLQSAVENLDTEKANVSALNEVDAKVIANTEDIALTQAALATTNKQVLLKANAIDVDTKIAAVASGSPKGTFATVALLQTDIKANSTDGKKNIYLVTADGGWYYWNTTAWKFGGIYQDNTKAEEIEAQINGLEGHLNEIKSSINAPTYSDQLTQTENIFTLGKGTNASSQVIDVSTSVVDGTVDFSIEGNTVDVHNGGATFDYANKTSGSTVANPNIAKLNYLDGALIAPSAFTMEANGSMAYDKLYSLDGVLGAAVGTVNGAIGKQLFSFDLISDYERKYGAIPITLTGVPVTDLANKIAWLKENITSLVAKWYGYGSCPSGNKAIFVPYIVTASGWDSYTPWGSITNASTPTYLHIDHLANSSVPIYRPTAIIDNNGFAHYLAYTDASNGTVASTIYTDYISLTMTLKPRWVSVGEDNGAYGLNKVNVLSMGKNHFNINTMISGYVINPTDGTLTVNSSYGCSDFIPIAKNTSYYQSGTNVYYMALYNKNKKYIGTVNSATFSSIVDGYVRISFLISNASNIQLELGTVATTYTPYVSQRQSLPLTKPLKRVSATVADVYKDGIVKRNISDWIELGGDKGWNSGNNYTGSKRTAVTGFNSALTGINIHGVKYNGTKLTAGTTATGIADSIQIADSVLYLIISNTDTGFVDSYTPSSTEIKAYFYGWKLCKSDGSAWDGVATKYWKKITDGTGITSTLPTASYSGYTPYKMCYQLATPTEETIEDILPLSSYPSGSMVVDSGLVNATTKYTIPLNFRALAQDNNTTINALKDYVLELDQTTTIALLGLADKELQMANVALLTTETTADLKNKINEVITIWK